MGGKRSGAWSSVRQGNIRQSVEKMAYFPFVDVLYIRCDWRDVHTGPGSWTLPGLGITFDAAKRHGLGVGFRIQHFSPNIQPQKFRFQIFCTAKFPSSISAQNLRNTKAFDFHEPRYDSPEFQKAFADLNELCRDTSAVIPDFGIYGPR